MHENTCITWRQFKEIVDFLLEQNGISQDMELDDIDCDFLTQEDVKIGTRTVCDGIERLTLSNR